MLRLEQLQRGSLVKGLTGEGPATVIDVKWYGSACIELTFEDPSGAVKSELLSMDATGVRRIRADLERVQALRLQSHFFESFFLQAFSNAREGSPHRPQRTPRRLGPHVRRPPDGVGSHTLPDAGLGEKG